MHFLSGCTSTQVLDGQDVVVEDVVEVRSVLKDLSRDSGVYVRHAKLTYARTHALTHIVVISISYSIFVVTGMSEKLLNL